MAVQKVVDDEIKEGCNSRVQPNVSTYHPRPMILKIACIGVI